MNEDNSLMSLDEGALERMSLNNSLMSLDQWA